MRFKLGYEAIDTKNYRRFGQQYLHHYPTDGILRKSKCAMKIVPEDPLAPIFAQNTDRRWQRCFGAVELGEANYDIHEISEIDTFTFARDEETLSKQILLNTDDRLQILFFLGTVEANEDIILYPRETEEIGSFDYSVEQSGLIYFNEFTGASSINDFEYSLSGNGTIYWSVNHSGSVRIEAEERTSFKSYCILNISSSVLTEGVLDYYIIRNGEVSLKFGFWREGNWLALKAINEQSGFHSIVASSVLSEPVYLLLEGEISENASLELDLQGIHVHKKNSPLLYFYPAE